MAKTALSQLSDQVELIRREGYEAGYAAAMRVIHEIASRPTPAENRPAAQRGRPPRQSKPAPREKQARQARADSKPAAKRPERGSNARFVEEVLRAFAPQAVRQGEIRAALQRD